MNQLPKDLGTNAGEVIATLAVASGALAAENEALRALVKSLRWKNFAISAAALGVAFIVGIGAWAYYEDNFKK